MIGFAPFNRPVAKVFLGDVGSLPIGLLLGWCLLQLGPGRDNWLASQLLLPLYYLADGTADANAADHQGRGLKFLAGASFSISISALPTTASRYGAWWAKSLRSIWRWPRSRSDRS